MLYCCILVRSNLEFGSLIKGQNSTDNLIDNVQYKFLKSIRFCLNLPISRNSKTLVEDYLYSVMYDKMSDMLIYDQLKNYIECPELLKISVFVRIII